VGVLPDGVFNLVHGLGRDAGQAIVAHPAINLISFTGGTATGRIVAATAAPLFKKVSTELGGKNATIVFGDVDLATAVAGAVRSAFTNNGQVCLAGSRVLVQRSIYPAFVERFVEAVRALRCGDPFAAATDVGPVSCQVHYDKIMSYIRLGTEEEGGKVLCGGGRPADLPEALQGGFFIAPTVIADTHWSARVATEEIFGPVCTVHAFEDEAEAVQAANSTKYGLAGSVWTNNLTLAHRVCRSVETGLLWVNCWLHRDLRTPFGGVKESGIGREGGKYSMDFYSELKNVCVFMGPP
jgi:aminomuconate-semialdehyde/2-hydroxymuconate-6-semialdehyde dehydrogenase